MNNELSLSVFVDESGSDILNTDPNDRYYVSVGIVIPTERVTEVKNQLDKISQDFNSGAVLKSKDIGKDIKRRLEITEKISPINFQYFAQIIDKNLLDTESGLRFRNSFYKCINKYLYQTIAQSSVGKVNVFIDSHGSKTFEESSKIYFGKQYDFLRTIQFNYESDKDNRIIQLADIIAGTIRFICNEGINEKTSKIRDILKYKEVFLRKWPIDKTSHLIININTEQVDKKIERIMLEKVSNYLENHSDSEEEYDEMRCKTLHRLYQAFYYDEGCIYAELLRNEINLNREKPIGEEEFLSSIIGGLRKEGIIITGTKKGYKLATDVNDIKDYIKHNQLIIMPMLHKLKTARQIIKTAAEFDILECDDFSDLKTILEVLSDKELFS